LPSKKRSVISPTLRLLEQQRPIFLDKNQGGKKLVEILRAAGFKVEPHSAHFNPEEDDHIWIPHCARRGWLIFSSDKGLETDATNRATVLESKALVFILEDGNNGPWQWGSSIIVSRQRIYQLVLDQTGPFYVDVQRETGSLVKRLRRPRVPEDSPTKESIVIQASE
jgi:hypothetical protein